MELQPLSRLDQLLPELLHTIFNNVYHTKSWAMEQDPQGNPLIYLVNDAKSLIAVMNTCRLFHTIGARILWRDRALSVTKDVNTLLDTVQYPSRLGSYGQWIKSLTLVEPNHDHQYQLVRPRADGALPDLSITSDLLKSIIQHCPTITDFSLCFSSEESLTRDIDFTCLVRLRNLKRLSLISLHCSDATAQSLARFAKFAPPLTSLSIKSCDNLPAAFLSSISTSARHHLQQLTLEGSDPALVTPDLLNHIATTNTALQSISLSFVSSIHLDPHLKALAACSSLTELHILGYNPSPTLCTLSYYALDALAPILPSLIRLTLFCDGITNSTLMHMARNLRNLEDLVLARPDRVLSNVLDEIWKRCLNIAYVFVRLSTADARRLTNEKTRNWAEFVRDTGDVVYFEWEKAAA